MGLASECSFLPRNASWQLALRQKPIVLQVNVRQTQHQHINTSAHQNISNIKSINSINRSCLVGASQGVIVCVAQSDGYLEVF
jgi:hypothetical protein